MNKYPQLNFRPGNKETKERLERVAAALERTVSDIIRECLRNGLPVLERRYKIKKCS